MVSRIQNFMYLVAVVSIWRFSYFFKSRLKKKKKHNPKLVIQIVFLLYVFYFSIQRILLFYLRPNVTIYSLLTGYFFYWSILVLCNLLMFHKYLSLQMFVHLSLWNFEHFLKSHFRLSNYFDLMFWLLMYLAFMVLAVFMF